MPEKKMNQEVFEQIQSQNMGEGTMLLDEEPEDNEQEDDLLIETKAEGEIEFEGEYSEKIIEDILKNPGKYKMTSPKHGEMNLKEAFDNGYNPETDEFDKGKRKTKEEFTEGLSDSDKEAIDHLTDPANAKIPPADAEMYGVTDPRMIAGNEEDMLAEMPATEEGLMPEGEGEMDLGGLEALLGGGGM